MPFSQKIQKTSVRWLLNFYLAVVIFCTAEAGRLIGIKTLPLNFSTVWPAAGFSLAALMLFGYKTWPGIFIGNLMYNFYHLYLNNPTFIGPGLAASAIAFGSLLQALIGYYIIRRFSAPPYFKKIQDVVIFLLAGGMVTCVIAATCGVSTLYFYGVLAAPNIPFTWLTFWLGDTMGVFIFTPLLVVWSLEKSKLLIKEDKIELAFIVTTFLLLSFFTFVMSYPLTYMFFPFSIWVSYRYNMHGATAFVFLLTVLSIITTSFGYGKFSTTISTNPLMIVVNFLQTIAANSLIIASLNTPKEK